MLLSDIATFSCNILNYFRIMRMETSMDLHLTMRMELHGVNFNANSRVHTLELMKLATLSHPMGGQEMKLKLFKLTLLKNLLSSILYQAFHLLDLTLGLKLEVNF